MAFVGPVSGLQNNTGFIKISGHSYQLTAHRLNGTYAKTDQVCNGYAVYQKGGPDGPTLWKDYYGSWNAGPSTAAARCPGWGDCTFCYFTCAHCQASPADCLMDPPQCWVEIGPSGYEQDAPGLKVTHAAMGECLRGE